MNKVYLSILLMGLTLCACSQVKTNFGDKGQEMESLNPYQLKMDGSDDTSNIQRAIAALEAVGGGVLTIPNSSRFYLSRLKLGNKVHLRYSESSDLSSDSGHTKNSGELSTLLSGANKNGVVNERVIAAPFHPGLILDVRKELDGQIHLLGKKQEMSNPARASFIIRDEGMNQVIMQYTNFRDNARFAGFNISMQRNLYVIGGVGRNSFRNSISTGDVVSDSDKTAFGIIEDLGDDTMTILWTSGRFKKGKKLVVNKETSKSVIRTVQYKREYTNSIGLNRDNGYTSIGLPNSNASEPLSVGGGIGIQASREFGQYMRKVLSVPRLLMVESFEKDNPRGYQMTAIPYKNTYRPVIKDVEGKTEKGHIGAVNAHTSFNENLIQSGSSYNVINIQSQGKGTYRVNFKTAFASADYQVGLSTSHPLEFAYVETKYKNYLIIKVVKTGTTMPMDITKSISVICVGGD